METKRRIRPELEGLRTIAAILVAIYHIWFNRVSGGVDVFFVVSGFLITTSLLSMYRKNGKVLYFSYIVKLMKRLLPTAWLISITTLIAVYTYCQCLQSNKHLTNF
ncbi:acyltransferase family protein [Planococcus faecalis]|uniref:acyltransferase family protein n=1 Tax=Planococcus faecalis TaxID=1598147 RepID=UPI0009F221C8|nr:acyltransferase [Planococcus faecalis]